MLTGATSREFAQGILEALTDRPRAAAIGRQARLLADTKYSYDAYLERTRQACAALAGNEGPAAVRGAVHDKDPAVKDPA